jgi:type II secretory pathway pseudopilin PulG
LVTFSRPTRCTRGFALIDCIVATVLLGIALSVMIGLASNAISSQTTGEKLATAATLADEQLQLVLARGPDDYAHRFPVQGQCETPFTDYSYKLDLTGSGGVGTPYTVACTISWNAGGSPRTLSIDTLMAPRTGAEDVEPDPLRAPQTAITRTQ